MRIRTIKPEFFHHEGLFDAESASGLPLRVAYAGLWCAADREGRFKWEPRRLGIQILPYDNVDFSRVLDALVTRGFLVKYRVGDACFGAIPSFNRHQIINNKERASEIPDWSSQEAAIESVPEAFHACPTREPRDDHACRKEGKGKEGNMEGNKEWNRGQVPKEVEVGALSPIPEKTKRYEKARPVLLALNESAGKGFREVDSNLSLIAARLAEPGVTVDGCITMVRRMVSKWGSDPKMSEYLRPQTLFAKEKFDSYYAAKDQPILDHGHIPTRRSTGPDSNPRNAGLAWADEWARERDERCRREAEFQERFPNWVPGDPVPEGPDGIGCPTGYRDTRNESKRIGGPNPLESRAIPTHEDTPGTP